VKPDLAANGQNLLSTSDANDQAYLEMPGTSMASPTAAGIAVLIAQSFDDRRGRPATGTDIKAVLIHSATEAGRPGPDVEFGWGVVNALAAGDIVARRNEHLIETVSVTEQSSPSFTLKGSGAPVRVTLVWNDPPGRANTGGVDDRTSALENDLDVELVAPDGTRHFPYRLDVNSPLAVARRDGVNRVDNVEVVDAPGVTGNWQLRIRANQLGQGAAQRATIVTSGLQR
jgi:subtilisin family serine protease